MKATVRYGLIYAGISIGISLLAFGLGIEREESVETASKFINIILPAIIIYLGIKEKRDQENNGFLNFGSGFSAGMIISLIGGAITAVYTYLYMTVLYPGIATYIKMKQEEEMISRGMSDTEVEQFAETMEFWTSPGVITGFAFAGILLIGLVISLIMAGVLKKENPNEMI